MKRHRPKHDQSYQQKFDEMLAGKASGVFIDDSGSPGLKDTPYGLHPDRKTWVAVILLPDHATEVMEQMPKMLAELKRLTGANEYHWVDIFGGRHDFKGVDPEIRFGLIGAMAEILGQREFPILVQTLDPVSMRAVRAQGQFPDRISKFNLRKHEDFALFLLLTMVKSHLKQFPEPERVPAHVFIDEGFLKRGQALQLPSFDPIFSGGLLCSADSSSVFPIQLADFAAFCLNRSQLILGKEKKSENDIRFLRLIEPMAPNYINLERKNFALDQKGNWLL